MARVDLRRGALACRDGHQLARSRHTCALAGAAQLRSRRPRDVAGAPRPRPHGRRGRHRPPGRLRPRRVRREPRRLRPSGGRRQQGRQAADRSRRPLARPAHAADVRRRHDVAGPARHRHPHRGAAPPDRARQDGARRSTCCRTAGSTSASASAGSARSTTPPDFTSTAAAACSTTRSRCARPLWRETSASYQSDELDFDHIHQMPKPLQAGGVPIWVSGTLNQRVIDRVARFGAGGSRGVTTSPIPRRASRSCARRWTRPVAAT